MARTHPEPQHDAHMDAYDRATCWHAWPENHDLVGYLELKSKMDMEPLRPETVPAEVTTIAEDKYVIACSDSTENLYWSNELGWTTLVAATVYTRQELREYGEAPVVDGFWMPLERAQELEQ